MVIDGDLLRNAVDAHVVAGTVPGAVLAVATGGETYVAAVGEVRGDAVVRLSSMTKPLMAALTLMLAEDGVLSAGDGIERWIPELADRRVLRRPDGALDDTVPAERPVTVDDLLTMRMGFGLHFDGPCPVLEEAASLGLGIGPPDPACPLTPDEWIARFTRLPLMYQPGMEWTYDLAFGVLGVLLARPPDRRLPDRPVPRARRLTPRGEKPMEYKLELVLVPVTDVDRTKAFYAEKLGFNVDLDVENGEDFRVVQFTPPGSSCSLSIGKGITRAVPGSVQGLHLVVTDIEAAHADLVSRGAPVSEIFHFVDGDRRTGPVPDRGDYGSFLSIDDPDGNTFLIQEVGHKPR